MPQLVADIAVDEFLITRLFSINILRILCLLSSLLEKAD
jgi:hypothetical protein